MILPSGVWLLENDDKLMRHWAVKPKLTDGVAAPQAANLPLTGFAFFEPDIFAKFH
jgi:hypothetical protein